MNVARGSASFRQSDLTRALKATKAAGIDVARIEIEPETGRIVIVPGKPPSAPAESGNRIELNPTGLQAIQDALQMSRRAER